MNHLYLLGFFFYSDSGKKQSPSMQTIKKICEKTKFDWQTKVVGWIRHKPV